MAKSKASELTPKINLVFVCSGNTCRSPMAEYIFKKYLKSKKSAAKYIVSSAGVFASEGDEISEQSELTLKKLGVTLKKLHKARSTSISIIQNADIIVCMTEAHRKELIGSEWYMYAAEDGKDRIIGTAAELTGNDISDPYGGTAADYEFAASCISAMCEPLLTAAESFRNNKFKAS